MPEHTVACCGGSVFCAAVVNRQMQRNSTVASNSIGIDMSWSIRRIRVIRVPPSKTVACNNRGVASSAVVNRQIQRDHAVATNKIRNGECRILRGGIGYAVPHHAVADRCTGVAGIAVVDRQMQRNGTVASGCIGIDMSCGICRIRVIRVPPSKAVAHNSGGVAR